MPLVLTLRQGEDFYANDDQFTVQAIEGPTQFVLHDCRGRTYTITDKHSTEVCGEVFVSAGDEPPSNTARVAINAPRHISIIRGEVLRKKRA